MCYFWTSTRHTVQRQNAKAKRSKVKLFLVHEKKNLNKKIFFFLFDFTFHLLVLSRTPLIIRTEIENEFCLVAAVCVCVLNNKQAATASRRGRGREETLSIFSRAPTAHSHSQPTDHRLIASLARSLSHTNSW
jgi:hypothetical protein